MIDALIFDFGGVLMKTLDYSYRHAWDDRLKLPHGSVEQAVHGSPAWRRAQINQITIAAYWQDVADQLGLDANELAALQADYFKGDILDTELIDLIRSLKARGVRVGLLSNDGLPLREKLQTLGIADLFDPLVISAEIGVMKPAPEAYQAVLEILNLPPEDVAFVDDMPDNIAGANAVGMQGILYQSGMNLRDLLETRLRNS